MSFHLVPTSHFMFWSVAQLLLILQVCLGREGTIEESIRTKRVISYLKNPKSGGHSDFSKKIVETFHRVVKKILSKNDTDYTDSKASHLPLNGRKRPNPKSFDYDVEDGVLSESGGYSVKVLGDPSVTSSNADESFYDGTDDILIERPIIRKSRVIKRSPPEEDSTTEMPNNNDSEDYYRRVRNVWKRVEEIISEKKIRKSTLLDSLKRRIRKRKWVDDSDDDDDDEETQIESGVGLGVEEDNVRLLSLLPLLPVSDPNDDDENDEALQLLFLCVFGALSLLGMAILIMGIYSAALSHVSGGAVASPEPMENFKRTCMGIIGKIPGFGSEDSVPPEETDGKNSKKEGSEGSSSETEGPKRNPEDVDFLLRSFVGALDKRPSRSLDQKYGSKTHLSAVRRIIRKKI